MRITPFKTDDRPNGDNPSPRLTGALLVMVLAVVILAAEVASPAHADNSPPQSVEPQAQQPAQTIPQPAEKATRVAKKHVTAKTPTASAKTIVRKAKQAAKANGEHVQVGMASWYGRQFARKKTSSGEKFSPNLPTAAHRTLPLGTHVKVTNLATGQSTTVRVTDRGPYVGNRVIDLSRSAAADIGMKHEGLAPVKVEVIGHDTSASQTVNNAQVKQEAAAQKSDGPATMTETASAVPVPSAPPTVAANANAPPQTSVAAPTAQPKPAADESPKPWRRLNRR